MNLIFINRYFHPDYSATSKMLSDLAFTLSERGKNVSVITSRQRYDAPTIILPSKEFTNGVSIYRVWTSRFGRANSTGRLLDYITFYISSAWRLWWLVKQGDVVIAKTDPPMLSLIAVPICWFRGARLINWLQDLFPEVAQALRFGGHTAQLAYNFLRPLRNRSLKYAHMNVVVGEHMANRVSQLGIPRDRIQVIPNWADGGLIAPLDPQMGALRTKWNLGHAFVVTYSGNLGRAHDIVTILDAMSIIENGVDSTSRQRRPVFWLFVGGGALSGDLKSEIERRKLKSVCFKPYQPIEMLTQSLAVADAHLVSLRPELEGLVVPSKFYGIAAAGRPVIFIGDKDGEIARLISRYDCGWHVRVGDGLALAQLITKLAAQSSFCANKGRRAREAFEIEFDKSVAMHRWENLLRKI